MTTHMDEQFEDLYEKYEQASDAVLTAHAVQIAADLKNALEQVDMTGEKAIILAYQIGKRVGYADAVDDSYPELQEPS
jgi:hypothetical protein